MTETDSKSPHPRLGKAAASALSKLKTTEARANLVQELFGARVLYIISDALVARRAAGHTLSAEEKMWLKVVERVRARYRRGGRSKAQK